MESLKYYIVSGDMLPEAAVKTVEATRLLKNGEAHTMSEAARAVGISRSVFYKYKDKVHPFYDRGIDRTVTLYAQLQDRAGVLSSFLGIFAGAGANILTMNQNIPVDGTASISVTAQTGELVMELSELLERLRASEGVVEVDFITGE